MALKRVALTGSSGMMGKHLMCELNKLGVSVASASRTRPLNLKKMNQWHHWDLADWKSVPELDKLFPRAQAVFHVGALLPSGKSKDDAGMIDANVRSVLCLGEWALKRKIPFVFLSGAIVYRNPEGKQLREDAVLGFNAVGEVYGLSKLFGEQILEYLSSKGLRVIVLRASSIYGSGLNSSKLISTFLRQASAGAPIKLAPPFDDRINLIHASDVAQAMIQSLNKKAWGVYNISGNHSYTLKQIAEGCVEATGNKSKIILSGKKRKVRGGRERFPLNCVKGRRSFSFSPKQSLLMGLKEMYYSTKENL